MGWLGRLFGASPSPKAYADAGVRLTHELVQSLGLEGWKREPMMLPEYTAEETAAIDKEMADFQGMADDVAAKEGGPGTHMLFHPEAAKVIEQSSIARALEDLASRGSSFGRWDDPDETEVPDDWQQKVSAYLKAWAANLSPTALLGMGELLSRVGRKREAQKSFEIALLYPQYDKSRGRGDNEEFIEMIVKRARADLQKL